MSRLEDTDPALSRNVGFFWEQRTTVNGGIQERMGNAEFSDLEITGAKKVLFLFLFLLRFLSPA